jgi:hypothetical protein
MAMSVPHVTDVKTTEQERHQRPQRPYAEAD